MTRQVLKSLRLPAELVAEAEIRAQRLGLTLADLVEAGLRNELGDSVEPRIELLKRLATWVASTYPSRTGFPHNVTLLVIREMQSDEGLLELYRAATERPDPKAQKKAQSFLHRQVGLMVKRVLNACVIGRSNPLDPEVELIRSHALLVPNQ
jgi:hypothetical protein